MAVDWSNGILGAAGGVLAAVVAGIFTKSESAQARRRLEIEEVSVRAAEDSKKFALAGEQKLINERVADDLSEIKFTVKTFDQKLDDLLVAGRLSIKREP